MLYGVSRAMVNACAARMGSLYKPIYIISLSINSIGFPHLHLSGSQFNGFTIKFKYYYDLFALQ